MGNWLYVNKNVIESDLGQFQRLTPEPFQTTPFQ